MREQLAGDLLICNESTAGFDRPIATGYLANARRLTHEDDRYLVFNHEDTIDNFGRTFLGLTWTAPTPHLIISQVILFLRLLPEQLVSVGGDRTGQSTARLGAAGARRSG